MAALLKLDKNGPVASHCAVKDWTCRISEMSSPVKTGSLNAWRTVTLKASALLNPLWCSFLWGAKVRLEIFRPLSCPACSVGRTCCFSQPDLLRKAGRWTSSGGHSGDCQCLDQASFQPREALPAANAALKTATGFPLLSVSPGGFSPVFLLRGNLSTGHGRSALERGKGSREMPLPKL